MIVAAALIGVVVVAVGLRALPRPAAKMLVDLLYAAAQRMYAAARAADAGLVRYRTVRTEVEAGHSPEYAEVTQWPTPPSPATAAERRSRQ